MLNCISKAGTVLACAMLVAAYIALQSYDRNAAKQDYGIALNSLPQQLGQWHELTSSQLDVRSQQILNVDQTLKRIYDDGKGHEIELYIGYWKRQTGDSQAGKHSPVLCLPANGWKISSQENWEIPQNGHSENHNLIASSLVGDYQGKSSLFKYWFFRGGSAELLSDETASLWHTTVDLLLQRRSDGGIVEISVPISGSKDRDSAYAEANAVATSFIAGFFPQFQQIVAKSAN